MSPAPLGPGASAAPGTRCGSCAGPARPWLRTAPLPVSSHRPCATREEAIALPRRALSLVRCAGCGLVWNREFDPEPVDYAAGYDNAQHHSRVHARYTRALARHLARRHAPGGRLVVELGCGDGHFLAELCRGPGRGNRALGVDPLGARAGSAAPAGTRIHADLAGADLARRGPALVVARHVLEHLADPVAALRGLAAALGPGTGAALYLEVPDSGPLLAGRAPWDLIYEHRSYFDARSLRATVAAAGIATGRVRRLFGGRYLGLETRLEPGGAPPGAPRPRPPGAAPPPAAAARALERAVAEAAARLAAHARGGIALWGAGSRAVSLLNRLPNAAAVRCVVDQSPGKQGRYLPGTGHPIVAPEALAGASVTTVAVVNAAYRTEIAARVRGLGLRLALVEIA